MTSADWNPPALGQILARRGWHIEQHHQAMWTATRHDGPRTDVVKAVDLEQLAQKLDAERG